MMRRSDITQWGVEHPWQNENQIEQDLLLSMAMVEIANDPLLGSELVLRGGTAFHKLFPSRTATARTSTSYAPVPAA
mgnify:CR=1 FL=1